MMNQSYQRVRRLRKALRETPEYLEEPYYFFCLPLPLFAERNPRYKAIRRKLRLFYLSRDRKAAEAAGRGLGYCQLRIDYRI